MHIPDGFSSPPVFASGWALALGILSLAVNKVKRTLKEKTVPLMGVMAAFIFAAQMINFPVIGGTSGHLLGGMLAALTVGPFAGCIILSLRLIVQCLIFQDGGLTALGVNILNMAVGGTIISYYFYVIGRGMFSKRAFLIAVFIGSWFSVMTAATLCALELSLSGTSPLSVVLPAMLFVHMFIGIGEGLITMFTIGFIQKVHPDLIYSANGQ